jgi:hypothetical protein
VHWPFHEGKKLQKLRENNAYVKSSIGPHIECKLRYPPP